MKRLMLLRHAKSSWDSAALDDYERPLNARGREAAPAIGRHMRDAHLLPDSILCSSARRTVETYEHIAPHLEPGTPVTFEDVLYLADWPQLLERIRAAPDSSKKLLIVGHNPGLEQLTAALSSDPAETEIVMVRRMSEKFPTGALAILDFPVSRWRQVKAGSGRLAAFIRPKDL